MGPVNDFYYNEDDRTNNLYYHLVVDKEFEGISSCCLGNMYSKPIGYDICQLSGGCDILLYKEGDEICTIQNREGTDNSNLEDGSLAYAIENTEGGENSDLENEISGCSAIEKKLQSDERHE